MKVYWYFKNEPFFPGIKLDKPIRKRIVNQEEIIDFLKTNPGLTENQIMEELYSYCRNETRESNKKYAECLRRALRAGKISRVLARFPDRRRFIYFVP